MKTRLITILLTATLAIAALPTPATGQEAAETASLNAIGASASFGLFTTHMAINSLGDGWNAKTYTDDTALRLSAGYKGGVNAVSQSLTKLIEEDTKLGEDDKAGIGVLIEICTLVIAQADALNTHINAPSANNAADYQAKRTAAEGKIFSFMGFEEGVIPTIGDSIGKE